MSDNADDVLRYGIRYQGRLVGRVDVLPIGPGRRGISYWLDEQATGRGWATAACAQVIVEVRTSLGPMDLYAGVAHDNHKSAAVLHRLGFRAVADLDSHVRFRLYLGPGSHGPVSP